MGGAMEKVHLFYLKVLKQMHDLSAQCLEKSDEDLVEKSLENIDYFTCLFNRYEKKFLRYIQRISSFSFDEAEEVLQEAFVKLWQNLNEFDNSLKFSSWAYRVVHNETISQYKKSRSFGKDKKQNINEEIFKNFLSNFNTEKEVDSKLNSAKIKEILMLLEEKYRGVLVLKFLEDKTYDEIADILKKPPGTIATLINRAKKAFREVSARKNLQIHIN